jgi:hypothetical protein
MRANIVQVVLILFLLVSLKYLSRQEKRKVRGSRLYHSYSSGTC